MTAGRKGHRTPTYSTSHHLTKGFGNGECIRQQKQGKLKLGSGKKYLMEIESGLLLTEVRLFTSLTGNRKIQLSFLNTILVFICSPIRILQEQKIKAIPRNPSGLLEKVTHFGQGIKLMEQNGGTRRKNPVYFGKSIISLAKPCVDFLVLCENRISNFNGKLSFHNLLTYKWEMVDQSWNLQVLFM